MDHSASEDSIPYYAQGHPLGPPVSEWIFSPQMQALLEAYRTKYPEPTVPVPAEDELIYCTCHGGMGTRPMVRCSNGNACLYEWYHLCCCGLKDAPDGDCTLPLCSFPLP